MVTQEMTTLEFINTRSDLRTVASAIREVDFEAELGTISKVTIFAPVDLAFMDYSDNVIREILGDRNQTLSLLFNHTCSGELIYDQLVGGEQNGTIQGSEIQAGNDQVLLNHSVASVLEKDIRLKNGIVHIVDSLLLGNSEPKKIMVS